MEEIMLIIHKKPIPENRFEEGLRLSAALLGMDHIPILVFLDDGVECLLPDTLYKNSLKDYLRAVLDLAGVYVIKESLLTKGLSEKELEHLGNVAFLSFHELIDLIKKCKVITSF
jgi:sulfur relay (sulfurtransferase) DsrF/TusC family protein